MLKRHILNNIKPMCFSANASFGAGILLSVIGVAAIKKVQHPSQIPFASIPLIFAVQQISEGLLWLTLPNPDYAFLQRVITYVFLFLAQIVWPLWIPIAILLLEKKEKQRKIQIVLAGVGILLSFYLSYCLVSYHIQAKIISHHIFYQQDYPTVLTSYSEVLYIVATIAPAFFSHIKRMWILGVTILISYIIAVIFYEHYFVSVWCFFASIISISVNLIMLEIKNSNKTNTHKEVLDPKEFEEDRSMNTRMKPQPLTELTKKGKEGKK